MFTNRPPFVFYPSWKIGDCYGPKHVFDNQTEITSIGYEFSYCAHLSTLQDDVIALPNFTAFKLLFYKYLTKLKLAVMVPKLL